MTLPSNYELNAEVVGVLDLVEIDTTEGVLNFVVGDDAKFTDVTGKIWYGSKLISVSETEFSINGTAPSVQLSFTFIQDPDTPDLIQIVKDLGGVSTVKGRLAKFYLQYIGEYKQIFAPVFAPQLLTQRVMYNLDYAFEGPQVRTLTLTVEGPFNLRSRPVGGRYNTADHSRRVGSSNMSLEFMPNNASDTQTLFGL